LVKLKSFLVCIVFMLTCIPFCHADPAVSSVTGSVSNGGSVTITGSGFGTKSVVPPQLWDTVDNQSAYSGLSDGDTIPYGSGKPWYYNGEMGGNENVKYETTDTQRHANSSAMYKGGGSSNLGGLNVTDTGTVYVYWNFYGTTCSGCVSTEKYLRLSDATDKTSRTFSWARQRAYIYIPPNTGGCYAPWTAAFSHTNATWHTLEVLIDSSNAYFQIYVDGASQGSYDWSGQGCTAGTSFDQVWRIGWDGSPSITMYMDDIYVDNTAQRVMLCTGSTWSSRGHCEIQIPTAWSTGEITTTVNTGVFTNEETVYLYIVDSSNNANSSGEELSINI
jgi:hypothetical protein